MYHDRRALQVDAFAQHIGGEQKTDVLRRTNESRAWLELSQHLLARETARRGAGTVRGEAYDAAQGHEVPRERSDSLSMFAESDDDLGRVRIHDAPKRFGAVYVGVARATNASQELAQRVAMPANGHEQRGATCGVGAASRRNGHELGEGELHRVVLHALCAQL